MQFDAHPLIFENGLEQTPGNGRNMRQTVYRTGAVERYASASKPIGLVPASDGGIYFNPMGPVMNPPGGIPGKGYNSDKQAAMVIGSQILAADLAGMFVSNQGFLEVATALDGGAGYALGMGIVFTVGQWYIPYANTPLVVGLAPAVVPYFFGGDVQMLAIMGLAGAAAFYATREYNMKEDR